MADPEINIAVKADTSQAESALKRLENTASGAASAPADTHGSDTLAAGIERLADACEKGAEHIQQLDLGYLHDQFDELKGINDEMGGLGNALDDFETKLADISSRQAETAEGFRALQAELTGLSEAYRSGKLSADEAAAALAELTNCAKVQLATDKQLITDMRRLAGEQQNLAQSNSVGECGADDTDGFSDGGMAHFCAACCDPRFHVGAGDEARRFVCPFTEPAEELGVVCPGVVVGVGGYAPEFAGKHGFAELADGGVIVGSIAGFCLLRQPEGYHESAALRLCGAEALAVVLTAFTGYFGTAAYAFTASVRPLRYPIRGKFFPAN